MAEPIVIKGLAPGLTKEQLEAVHPGMTRSCHEPDKNPTTTELCGSSGIADLSTFGGVHAKLYLAHLRDGIVHTITISISPDDYDAAVAALTERFGKPVERKASIVKNRMGAEFDQVQTTWRRDGSILVGTKRAGSVDMSNFHLALEKDFEERNRRRKEDAKARAKDF